VVYVLVITSRLLDLAARDRSKASKADSEALADLFKLESVFADERPMGHSFSGIDILAKDSRISVMASRY